MKQNDHSMKSKVCCAPFKQQSDKSMQVIDWSSWPISQGSVKPGCKIKPGWFDLNLDITEGSKTLSFPLAERIRRIKVIKFKESSPVTAGRYQLENSEKFVERVSIDNLPFKILLLRSSLHRLDRNPRLSGMCPSLELHQNKSTDSDQWGGMALSKSRKCQVVIPISPFLERLSSVTSPRAFRITPFQCFSGWSLPQYCLSFHCEPLVATKSSIKIFLSLDRIVKDFGVEIFAARDST